MHEQTNTPAIRRMFPKKIFDATQTISAAFAMHWETAAGIPGLTEGIGEFSKPAKTLVEIAEEVSSEPAHDTELIDRWAKYLHLSDWYRWVAFEP